MEMRKEIPVLWIIVPCYDEAAVLSRSAEMFLHKLISLIENKKIAYDSRILFVNDGSRDSTWDIITSLSETDAHYIGISLSRNRGHQNALLAGLMESLSHADITISIDCDGQDDINAMDDMVDEYMKGNDIVYGVRNNRDTDSFFKRSAAECFYRFLSHLGADVVFNHADYRLLSARVLAELKNFGEVNLYIRGLIPLLGFKSSAVYFRREPRIAGKTHYPLRRSLGLALDGITSLSVKPLHIVSVTGFMISLLSFLGIVWSITRVFQGMTVQGWASMTCIICFVSGIQLIFLGIIGEYIGKIYLETKHRPRYIISDRTSSNEITGQHDAEND